ncbi:hypothetical protein GZH47_33635 (plasmid) [Paenibacillus rhizovicinus]|uniref:Uncharacterized protein n=1 Tax=Paenibacillus rhizovicinus TaxID=2704463 RepID=A0A6C0PBJ5_9BACL|nr:hypothetical protein [Paenibacillus rhizovicinus]QHW35836.1 hypothetical protein GZH47_33635 [Paenibacillus rhizovicinus]
MSDELIKAYQASGKSDDLVAAYKYFILKYYMLFRKKHIDFENYDIRQFMSCYIRNPEHVKSLRRGPKYQSAEARAAAYRMLSLIVKVFEDYDWARIPLDYRDSEIKDFIPYDDLYNELVMIFLGCAKDYVDQGAGFQRYVYKTFRYRLKHHIDAKMYDASDSSSTYSDMMQAGQRVPFVDSLMDTIENPLQLDPDIQDDLNNENWFNGYGNGDLFKDLSYMQRRVLVKYYECGYKDKDIARDIGYNPVYIGKVRRDLVEHFRDMRKRGEIKWLR